MIWAIIAIVCFYTANRIEKSQKKVATFRPIEESEVVKRFDAKKFLQMERIREAHLKEIGQ